MKTGYLIFLFLLASYIGVVDCYGQEDSNIPDSITITGVVVDEKYNEPIMVAHVALHNNDELICNTTTDFMGEFSFRIATAGITNLNMVIQSYGCKEYRITNINPLLNSISGIKVVMQPSDVQFSEIIMSVCDRLRLDPYSSGHTNTIKSDKIEKGAY